MSRPLRKIPPWPPQTKVAKLPPIQQLKTNSPKRRLHNHQTQEITQLKKSFYNTYVFSSDENMALADLFSLWFKFLLNDEEPITAKALELAQQPDIYLKT